MIKAVIFDMYETLITLFESPLYFGNQMSLDAGISEQDFLKLWQATEEDRTIGKITFEEILERILKFYDCYTEEKKYLITKKRYQSKEEAFEHLNPEIIPMLKSLQEKDILIGLISNCYSEEALVIKKSILYPYFDAVCLSSDEGMQKPDTAIFHRCLEKLKLKPEECLYVGDGGSHELEAAKQIGMKAVQALWYLKEDTCQPSKRKEEFEHAKTPLDVCETVQI